MMPWHPGPSEIILILSIRLSMVTRLLDVNMQRSPFECPVILKVI